MENKNNIPRFDTDVAWQKLDARIDKSESARSAKTLLYKRMAAAAAIVIVATAGWLIWETSRQWQTIAAVAGNQPVLLPDGSSVLLRKGSTVRYRKDFNNGQRTINLSGEAFFQVRQNGKYPFSIVTDNAEIKVLGTSFLVRSQRTTDEIVVSTGKVSVTGRRETNASVLLEAGQKLLIQEDKLLAGKVSDSNYIAWTTGILDFKNTPLQEALKDVSNYYETTVSLAENVRLGIENIHLTASFRRQSLEQVLEEIQLITGLEVKKDGHKVLLYKK